MAEAETNKTTIGNLEQIYSKTKDNFNQCD